MENQTIQNHERVGTGLCVSVEAKLVFEYLSDRCLDIDDGLSHEHGLCQISLAGDDEPSIEDFGIFCMAGAVRSDQRSADHRPRRQGLRRLQRVEFFGGVRLNSPPQFLWEQPLREPPALSRRSECGTPPLAEFHPTRRRPTSRQSRRLQSRRP